MRMREAMWSRALAARVKHNGYFLCGAALGLWIALAAVPLDEPSVPCVVPTGADPAALADEFEPAHTRRPMPSEAAPRAVTRPRYYSTELGMRAPLMAAVLTTEDALESRGAALNATLWSLHPALRLFTPAAARPGPHAPHWPNVVGFTDARTTLTPFHALKYLADNYLDDYHFFFLVSDDTYVNARRLTELVSQISVSRHLYLGVPSSPGSPYCTLSSGLLISRSVLTQLHSSLDWCVRNAYSPHHHENLGRCVLHAAKVPCQSSIHGQQYSSSLLSDSLTPALTPMLANSVSAHPVTDPDSFHQIHAYVSRRQLQRLLLLRRSLSLALLRLLPRHPPHHRNASWPQGLRTDPSLAPPPPHSRWDHARWTPFNLTHGFMLDDHKAMGELSSVWKRAIQMAVSAACAWSMSWWGPSPSVPPSCKLHSGAYHWEPAMALRYRLIIGVDTAADDGKTTPIVRQVELALPLGGARLVAVPYVTESAKVRLVLPVLATAQDAHQAGAFLARYVAAHHPNTHLILVLPSAEAEAWLRCESACEAAVAALRAAVAAAGTAAELMLMPTPAEPAPSSAGTSPLPYARAALQTAARTLPLHSLLLLITPNSEYNEDFLNRVRMNSVSGAQWYQPVPFSRHSLYSHPLFVDASGAKPAQRTGRFNARHEDVLAVYRADLDKALSACGADASLSPAELLGCGGPRVLRAPEPGLLRLPLPQCRPPDCPDLAHLDLGAAPDLAKLLLQVSAL